MQTKLHIVYIGMLQVTRSNIGFYLIYILIHIYLSIMTNQTDVYLIVLFSIVSLQKGIILFNSIIFEVMPNCFVFQFNI